MTDKMRESFSKHCHLWRHSEEVDENGFFTNPTTQRAWDVWTAAWQASRAAVVIKFTEEPYFCPSKTEIEQASDNGYADALSMVKQAITEAGVKYE